MRFAALVLVLLMSSLVTSANMFPFPGKPGTYDAPAPSGFVTVASSSYSAISSTLPTVHVQSAVDTSTWDSYDATCECANDACGVDDAGSGCTPSSGKIAFHSSWGCSPMVSNESYALATDSSSDYQCLLRGIGDDALLYIPDGTYWLLTANDGSAAFRPSPTYDNRGLDFESHAAILYTETENDGVSFGDAVLALEWEDMSYAGTEQVWASGAGAAAGSTVILVPSTTGFSTTEGAAGNYAYLNANATAIQGSNPPFWMSRVTAINPGVSVTIADPLPVDFTGGSATARAASPTLNFVVRNGTMAVYNSNHTVGPVPTQIGFKNNALNEISGMHFKGGYRSFISVEYTADAYIHGNFMTESTWDKAYNGYGVIASNSSRMQLTNNYIEHVTAIAVGGATLESWIALNDLRGPTGLQSAGTFDRVCTEGDGNDCTVVDHSSHSPTITAAQAQALCTGSGTPWSCCTGSGTGTCAAAYLHCIGSYGASADSGNYEDAMGWQGDRSCRGTASDALYSGMELHNAAGSNNTIERNMLEGSIWFDGNNGPGRDNVFFGNHLRANGVAEFNTAAGEQGGFFYKDEVANLGSYRMNHQWLNNDFEESFGTGTVGYNNYGDGMVIRDNVMRTDCLDIDDTGEDADGGDCTHGSVSGERVAAVNTTWADNTVGAAAHPGGYSRTMPSMLGASAWTDLDLGTYTGTAPFVGPDSNGGECLPITEDFLGSCP